MLKVIIAAAAVVLSVEVVAISFAPGAEITGTIPVRALKGDRLDDGLVALPKLLLERIERHGVGQVALIELQHVRDLLEIVAVLAKILLQVLQRLDIGVHAFFLGVRHENDTVYATQDQLAAGIVEDLAGYRVKVDASLEAANTAEIEGQEVEEKGAFRLRGQRDHLALLLLAGLLINKLQIGRLAAETGAVIDDLAINFPGREVDEAQTNASVCPAVPRRNECAWGIELLAFYITRIRSLWQLPQSPGVAC